MDFYVKKIKSKEGLNSVDLEKIKKNIPIGYKAVDNTPVITFTANHLVISFKVHPVKKANAPKKATGK